MVDTVKRYTRCDKNQAKIDRMVAAVVCRIDEWLLSNPTGQIVLNTEINANQGGVKDVYVTSSEKQKII